jgi:hypothetical protein
MYLIKERLNWVCPGQMPGDEVLWIMKFRIHTRNGAVSGLS